MKDPIIRPRNRELLSSDIESRKLKFNAWAVGAELESLEQQIPELEKRLKNTTESLAQANKSLARYKKENKNRQEQLIALKLLLDKKHEETGASRIISSQLKEAQQEITQLKILNKNLAETSTNLRNQLAFFKTNRDRIAYSTESVARQSFCSSSQTNQSGFLLQALPRFPFFPSPFFNQSYSQQFTTNTPNETNFESKSE